MLLLLLLPIEDKRFTRINFPFPLVLFVASKKSKAVVPVLVVKDGEGRSSIVDEYITEHVNEGEDGK